VVAEGIGADLMVLASRGLGEWVGCSWAASPTPSSATPIARC
jgi:hypothetical protein